MSKTETDSSTETGTDESDDSINYPRTLIRNGGYGEMVQRGDSMQWEEWSNFLLNPQTSIETVHGDQMMEVEVRPRNGENFTETVSPIVFNDVRTFKNEICSRMSTTWHGSQTNLNTLKQKLGMMDVRQKRGTDHMGLDVRDNIWVTPNRNLTEDGWLDETKIEYVEQGIVPERAWNCPDQFHPSVVARILELLPETRDTERLLPLVGWFYASSFRPYIMEWSGQFNMMSVTGETGSGKTATIETLWKMFGMDSSPFSVTDTAFTLDTVMGCTNSIPMWYDEYKPSDIPNYKIDRFLKKARDATRGGVSQRGNADKTSDQYRLQAPIVVSGEERIQGPAEERRSIFTCFQASTTDPGTETTQAFAKLTGGSAKVDGSIEYYEGPDLSQHALAWADYVLLRDEAELEEEWKEAGEEVNAILRENDIGGMGDLVEQGLQTIYFGCLQYRDFADGLGAAEPFTIADVEDAILYVADGCIGGTNRTDHLATLFKVACRAASEDYLEIDQHYTWVNDGEELRISLNSSLDPIRRYARDHDIPEDLLGSKSDYMRLIDDRLDESPYLTHKNQYSPPISRAVGINIDAAEAEIDGFEGEMFGLTGNYETESF